jgi:hypothetical protein
MTPKFELAMSNASTQEPIKNAHTLSKRFPEIGVDGDTVYIELSYDHDEFLTLTNHQDEELHIYPESGEWFLNKEVDLLERPFNLLGKVNIIPFQPNKGEIRVLMTDNDLEKTLVLYLEEGSPYSRFYGKVDPSMFPARGVFFKNRDDYIQAIELLEQITDLEIKDFFVRVTPSTGDPFWKGEIRRSEVQLAVDLK